MTKEKKANEWNLQTKNDIMSELSWGTSYFELKMKDGNSIKAWGFLDETMEGEINEHLEELETGEYNVIDNNDIVCWREIKS